MNKKIKKQNKARAFSLSFGEGWGGALILIIIFTISSCRKYPEGGSYFLTDMSKKIAGEYCFTHYYIDGVDSANYYFNKPDYTGKLYFKRIEQQKAPDFTLHFFENNIPGAFSYIGGSWDWENTKRTKIILSCFSRNGDTIQYPKPFIEHTKTTWDIRKLKDNDFFIETDFEGKHYRAELKK